MRTKSITNDYTACGQWVVWPRQEKGLMRYCMPDGLPEQADDNWTTIKIEDIEREMRLQKLDNGK